MLRPYKESSRRLEQLGHQKRGSPLSGLPSDYSVTLALMFRRAAALSFSALLFLDFMLLAILQLLCLLRLFSLHLLYLLLLAALELILLPLIVGPLAFQSLLLLDLSLLHLLTFRILLLTHFFYFALLFLLEPGINARTIRWPRGRGTVFEGASVICWHSLRAIRFPRIFGRAIRVAGSAGFYCATSVKFARPRSGGNVRTTVVHRGAQIPVRSGRFEMTILLRGHREVMFAFGSQLL